MLWCWWWMMYSNVYLLRLHNWNAQFVTRQIMSNPLPCCSIYSSMCFTLASMYPVIPLDSLKRTHSRREPRQGRLLLNMHVSENSPNLHWTISLLRKTHLTKLRGLANPEHLTESSGWVHSNGTVCIITEEKVTTEMKTLTVITFWLYSSLGIGDSSFASD